MPQKKYRPREESLKYYRAYDREKYEEIRMYYHTHGSQATTDRYGYYKNNLVYHFGNCGVNPPRRRIPMSHKLSALKVIQKYGPSGMMKNISYETDVKNNYWYDSEAVLIRA